MKNCSHSRNSDSTAGNPATADPNAFGLRSRNTRGRSLTKKLGALGLEELRFQGFRLLQLLLSHGPWPVSEAKHGSIEMRAAKSQCNGKGPERTLQLARWFF